MSMTEYEERRFQGIPVSEGIAIGMPYFLPCFEEEIPSFPITLKEVDNEIDRYRTALCFSREDLRQIHSNLLDEGSKDAATIIDTHIQMLEDPLITTHMEEKIRQMLHNTESVFHHVISDYESRFSKNTDPAFQEKSVDVMDLAKRVLGHLYPQKKPQFPLVPFNSIVFVKELIPSYTAVANTARVSAFVTQSGGGNSHAALIARAKGIPYVSCIDISEAQMIGAQSIIVDGQTGEVIFNPSPETLKIYTHRRTSLKTSQHILQKELKYDAETIDGWQVKIFANVGDFQDLENFQTLGAEGIGLFRTEYLFFERQHLFASEQEQYYAYSQMIEKAGDVPVVIRVFDIGGDKVLEPFSQSSQGKKESNSMLGCRGIRFLLRHPEIFRTQVRAILRAALNRDVRILLPLVGDMKELDEAKALIAEEGRFLLEKGIPAAQNVPLGSMIEVPSAVLLCDAIARGSDFLSIGTNDLVQYTLGVDRSDPGMSDSWYLSHPSIARMIHLICSDANRYQKSLTLCGEMASNPLFIPLLLGLGIHQFSCSPRYIPLVKRTVRKTTLLRAYSLAERVLSLDSTEEIYQTLLDAQRSTDT